ncbi:MAG: PD-(D/E)XK nuclease family protein [Candidatus Omnitrophica bacterium]|nr:PD-(D/E)XK nuclease family protein [Candidatus Omnitrophota bacterium]
MREKVITYSFGDNFINRLADYIEAEFFSKSADLSRIAVVFGGKRPGLFLKRELGKRAGKAFYPPRFFSIDEFIEYLAQKKAAVRKIQDLEACYRVYKLAEKEIPLILEGRETFSRFLAWAREIISFIDQMDMEDISDDALKNIQDNAEAGYDVPENINRLLAQIVLIRGQYHEFLKKEGLFSKGTLSLFTADNIAQLEIPEFDRVLFCNFFDLKNTQKKVIKHLLDNGRAAIFFQSEEKAWPEQEGLGQYFGEKIIPDKPLKPRYKLDIYSGFDMHSQVGIVRELVKKAADLDKTVIVLPNPDSVVPLLSEISDISPEFNVSLGYPVPRSSLYTLFGYIINSRQTMRDDAFYAKDYLKVLKHPFIKNLRLKHDGQLTRILAHKIEDILTGSEENPLGGSLFVKLADIEDLELLHTLVLGQARKTYTDITKADIRSMIREIHRYAFEIWQDIKTFNDLADALDEFMDVLIDKSFLDVYALNLKISERVYSLRDEFRSMSFAQEHFSGNDILKIFDEKLKTEKISFTGIPLKGLQVLGLFETRSLDFENVIIMDVNESILPKLKIHDPLIPRQVMMNLGFNQLELEDAIQRYHFMRLIASAKTVSLVYDNSPEKQRSRFIEELIWDREMSAGKLNVVPITRASFNLNVLPASVSIAKTDAVLNALEKFTFSPSGINTYLNCPLQFYYQYMLCLKEQEDLLEEPQSRQIGNFIHKLLEDSYKTFINAQPVIDEKFRLFFFKEFEKRFDAEFSQRMKSDSFMLKQIMRYRLEKFLENEAERCVGVKQLIGLELGVEDRIDFKQKKVPFKCRIDRVDRMEDGAIIVIDYKTGNIDSIPKNAQKLKAL